MARANPSMTSLNINGCTGVSDVGLWAVTQFCPDLRELRVRGVHGITHVALRSLALKCKGLEVLDMGGCDGLDDLGLRCVASGLWGLKHIGLAECERVTDKGAEELADCCRRLEVIDIARSRMLSDRFLLQAARFAQGLRTLQLSGAPRVTDDGLVQILAVAGPRLREIDFSSMPNVGALTFRAMAAHCNGLVTLDLSRCAGVDEAALVDVLDGRAAFNLRSLKLKRCQALGIKTANAIARSCQQLRHLDLSFLPRLDARAVTSLTRPSRRRRERRKGPATASSMLASMISRSRASEPSAAERGPPPAAGGGGQSALPPLSPRGTPSASALASALSSNSEFYPLPPGMDMSAVGEGRLEPRLHRLRSLDLSGCKALGEKGIAALLTTYTRLTVLRIDRCRKVSREFVQKASDESPYVRAARDYYGFEPLPDAEERMRLAELRRLQHEKLVVLQAWWRGEKARAEFRRRTAAKRGGQAVLRLQTLWRGRRERHRLRRVKLRIACSKGALALQKLFRAHVVRVELRAAAAAQVEAARLEAAATVLGRVYRGHLARRLKSQLFNEKAIRHAVARRQLDRYVWAAVRIQASYRRHKAWVFLKLLRQRALEEVARVATINAAARVLQRTFRMLVAQRTLLRLIAARNLLLARLRGAIELQRVWRGYVARLEAGRRRAARDRQIQKEASTKIQACWRGLRARQLTAMIRAFAHLRAVEHDAALRVQTRWRMYQAAAILRVLQGAESLRRERFLGALTIQKHFRGMMGRREALFERTLRDALGSARELMAIVQRNTKLRDKEEVLIAQLAAVLERMAKQQADWRKEEAELRVLGTAMVDSDKITGVSQRYQATFVADHLGRRAEKIQIKIERASVAQQKATQRLRLANRRLREAQRRLEPLQRTVEARFALQLEEERQRRRRRRFMAASRIQGLARGWLVRAALRRGSNHWICVFDARRASWYYWNLLTQTSRWKRPMDYAVWGGWEPQELVAGRVRAELARARLLRAERRRRRLEHLRRKRLAKELVGAAKPRKQRKNKRSKAGTAGGAAAAARGGSDLDELVDGRVDDGASSARGGGAGDDGDAAEEAALAEEAARGGSAEEETLAHLAAGVDDPQAAATPAATMEAWSHWTYEDTSYGAHAMVPGGNGWWRGWDEASQAFYFYSSYSGEYRWTEPAAFATDMPQEYAAAAKADAAATGLPGAGGAAQAPGADLSAAAHAADDHQDDHWPDASASWYGGSVDPAAGELQGEAAAEWHYDPSAAGANDATWWDEQNHAELAVRAVVSRRFGSSAWVEVVDPQTGATWYSNEHTGQSAWSLPPTVLAHDQAYALGAGQDTATAQGEGGVTGETAAAAAAAEAEAQARPLPAAPEPSATRPLPPSSEPERGTAWLASLSEADLLSMARRGTGEAALRTGRPPPAQGWQRLFDPNNAVLFYYNPSIGVDSIQLHRPSPGELEAAGQATGPLPGEELEAAQQRRRGSVAAAGAEQAAVAAAGSGQVPPASSRSTTVLIEFADDAGEAGGGRVCPLDTSSLPGPLAATLRRADQELRPYPRRGADAAAVRERLCAGDWGQAMAAADVLLRRQRVRAGADAEAAAAAGRAAAVEAAQMEADAEQLEEEAGDEPGAGQGSSYG